MSNPVPLTIDMSLGKLLEIMAERYEAGESNGVFQVIAVPTSGGDPLLFTIGVVVAKYEGQEILPGNGGMTKQ